MTIDVSTVLIHIGQCLEQEPEGVGTYDSFLRSCSVARYRCRSLFCDYKLNNIQLDTLLTNTDPAEHPSYLADNPCLQTRILRNSSCRLEEFVLT